MAMGFQQPGISTARDRSALRIAQLRAEIALASATLHRATAKLRALEAQPEPVEAELPVQTLSRSRSEGPNG